MYVNYTCSEFAGGYYSPVYAGGSERLDHPLPPNPRAGCNKNEAMQPSFAAPCCTTRHAFTSRYASGLHMHVALRVPLAFLVFSACFRLTYVVHQPTSPALPTPFRVWLHRHPSEWLILGHQFFVTCDRPVLPYHVSHPRRVCDSRLHSARTKFCQCPL
jgi:hypothetical protein